MEPPSRSEGDDAALARQLQRWFGAPDAGAVEQSRYRVLAEIGAGGMGRVFRAIDTELGREVALKVPRSAADLARLRREARITGQLEHPNIVPVHALASDAAGMPFFTMKLVGGRTLRRALHESRSASGRPSLEPWIGCLLKVCDALAFAHARGFVHRDLKPDNVMVGDFGEVLVMDWGLAKEPGPSRCDADGPDAGTSGAAATVAGSALGSPPYMAPEQARGDAAAIDARTDVFGAGAILHEILFGVPPYSGAGGDEIVARAARAERVRVGGRAPRELRAIVERALAASPADRYPSIEAFAADLRAWSEGRRGSAWRDPPHARLVKLARRRPAATIASAAAVLLALAAVALQAERRARHSEAAGRAQIERMVADQRLQAELFTLRSAGAAATSGRGEPDYADLAAAYLARFREHALALDGAEPVEAVATALRRRGAEDPAVAAALAAALYDLARQLTHAGVPALSTGGGSPPAALDALVTFWPRLEALLALHEQDPWRREVWRAWRSWSIDGRDRFDAWLDDAALADRSATELEWLAELIAFARGGAAAIPMLDRALELDPGLYWAHFHRGLIAHQSEHDLSRAEREYELAIALRPQAPWPRWNLALLRAEQGDRTEALRHARAVVAAHPRDALAHFFLGNYLRHDGQTDAAIAEYERAAELDPRAGRARSNLGLLLRQEGRLDDAIAAFRGALAVEPHPWIANHLGFALLERGAPAEAIVAFETAIRLAPELADGHWGLGNARRAGGDLAGASIAYHGALAVDPDCAEAHLGLALCAEAAGRLDEALERMRQCDRLGRRRADWDYPSAERIRELEARLRK